VNGDCKLQLLPAPWPPDALPRPTSSLLAVASSKGLVAAAAPQELVIATTASIRNTWQAGSAPENNVKTFSPSGKITVPRLSHVAFSADENVLVVASESSGGLAAYKTDTLTRGQPNPALEVSTNNQALRALAPNPNVQFAELFAALTTDGDLLMADLKEGQLRPGASRPVLESGVSCLSWSNQGKQLVAGLGDGTVVQMMPDGTPRAKIPRPPALEGDKHVSALSWLSNDTFLIIYSLTSNTDDVAQPSDYFVVWRQPETQNYTFHALPEVCPAFGLNRSPGCQYITRLRNFKPHIDELLVLASTTSVDLGVVTKANVPLSQESVTDSYTLTMPADDSRRAQLPLPLTEGEGDTSPIGLALDLSATASIVSPIPSDPEIEESPGPLPNIFALNHEGVLSSWWIVYSDSIREKTTYSGLAVMRGSEQALKQVTPGPAQSVPASPSGSGRPGFAQTAFGQSAFAAQRPFAKAATATFGSGSDTMFGSPNTLSGDKPSWTSTGFAGVSSQSGSPGFGQPAFGASTNIGGVKPTLGAPSPFVNRPALGQPAASMTAGLGATFGQTGTVGARNPNPFGGSGSASTFGGSAAGAKGFASFSNQGGFSALASNQPGQGSLFGRTGNKEPVSTKPDQPGLFAPNSDAAESRPALSGFGGKDFSMASTFKRDETSEDVMSKTGDKGEISFGGDLGDALEQTQQETACAQSKEEEMDEGGAESTSTTQSQKPESAPLPPGPKPQATLVTPPSTISQPKTTPIPPVAGLFSAQNQPGATSTALENNLPGWSLQQAPSTTPKETPTTKTLTIADNPSEQDRPLKIKSEPPSEESPATLRSIPEAPLPPDPTSKSRYVPGDTPDASDESKLSNGDAHLPPDFVAKRDYTAPDASQASLPDDDGNIDDGGGGGDDFSSDFEGSVENEMHEISPTDEPTGDQAEQIQTSPESSFGKEAEGSEETSPAGGLFTKVSTSKSTKLFGEVTTGPILAPPVPQESPRSPSPVRNVPTADLLRPEPPRSVSAPTRPQSTSALDRRRAELTKSALVSQPLVASQVRDRETERTAAAEKAKAKAEAEAALHLEDDEDARLRTELETPPSPSQRLEAFLPHQHGGIDSSNKSGIPGQIERLYRDINSMIDTLGINARSLSAYFVYQTGKEPYKEWPEILNSEAPRDALSDEWVLQDITRLHEGEHILHSLLEKNHIDAVREKFEQCQGILNRDLAQLRMNLTSTRKALRASSDAQAKLSAPLSAEQASLQHDLRKASMSVQTKLVKAEQELTFLRAKLVEARPPRQENGIGSMGKGVLGRPGTYKKPTVEAVSSTIARMTSMAEKKSTDIDVLEAQLRKLGLTHSDSIGGSRHGSMEPNGTPPQGTSGQGLLQLGRTPTSRAGSIYHTPESRFGESTLSALGSSRTSLRASVDDNGALVSTQDSERWKERARRKKVVHGLLKEALAERKKTASSVKT
jgi:nucleoporin NUP159